jgi:hypothetical protein
MWQQWLNGLLGLWLIALPFTMGLGTGVTWTLVITGAGVAILGFWGAIEHKGMEHRYHRTA